MEIKKTQSSVYTNFKQQQKTQNNTAPVSQPQSTAPLKSASAGVYQAYNNISFKGKPYDGTNFREDLKIVPNILQQR